MSPSRIKSDQVSPVTSPLYLQVKQCSLHHQFPMRHFQKTLIITDLFTFSCISDIKMKVCWSHCCSFKLSELSLAAHSNYSLAFI